MGREAVAQGVAGRLLGDARGADRLGEGALHDGLVEVVAAALAGRRVEVLALRREDPLPGPEPRGGGVLAVEGLGKGDAARPVLEVGLVKPPRALDLMPQRIGEA